MYDLPTDVYEKGEETGQKNMLQSVVLVLLIILGSHVSHFLPVGTLNALHARSWPTHAIILASLFVLSDADNSRPPHRHLPVVVVAWLATLLFVKAGSVVSVVVLAMLVIHQMLSRYLKYYLAHPDSVVALAQKVQLCKVAIRLLEILVAALLVASAIRQYISAKVTGKSPIHWLLSTKDKQTKAITGHT